MTDLVVNPRFDFAAPLPQIADLGRVHFIGIGGSGMSGIAHLYAAAGRPVSGCDGAESDTLATLARAGVDVCVGHSPAHLDTCDTLVVSSAVPEANPELAAARARGLRILHRAQALSIGMGARTRVAVAGANGKTTTSAMVATILIGTGREPGYAIGSPLVTTGASSGPGRGPEFVVEADESDGSFLAYGPDVAVVTNVQPDHLDFYGDLAHVEAAYAAFAASIRPGGLLVVDADDPGGARLAASVGEAGHRVVTYGEGPAAIVRLTGLVFDGTTSQAVLTAQNREIPIRVTAPGRHNLHNAAAALTAAWFGLGVDPEAAAWALADFAGTRRRFEIRGAVAGVTVIDDYAHNAPKVAALIAGARAVAGTGAIRVVFQPHLFSRTRDFAPAFAAGLAGADQVVLLPVYAAREAPMPGVTSHLIADALAGLGRRATMASGPQDAVAALVADANPGDLVLTVGAGDVTRLAPLVLDALARRC
jgi:UDP-N-acetylmuramate--alanine ligase